MTLSQHRIAFPVWQKKTRSQRPAGAVNLPVMFSDSIKTFYCLCFSPNCHCSSHPLFTPLILKASLSTLQNKWRERGLFSGGIRHHLKSNKADNARAPQSRYTQSQACMLVLCGCQRWEAGSLLTPRFLLSLKLLSSCFLAQGRVKEKGKGSALLFALC